MRPLVTTLLSSALLFSGLVHATPTNPPLEHLPTQGVRFATQLFVAGDGQNRFIIAQVDGRGLSLLNEEAHSDYHSLYWADHQLLIGTAEKDGGALVQRYVDGKRDGPPIVIPRASWSAGELETYYFELLVEKTAKKKSGEPKVFVGTCFEHSDDPDGRCKQYRAMAFDPRTGALGPLLKKRPPNTLLSNVAQRGVALDKLPKLKAAPGYTVKLHKTDILDGSAMMGDGRKVPAFTCTGPEGSATWPTADVINWEFRTRPKAFRWVSHDPPLYVVTGPATNPIGQTTQSATSFRGCSRQALEDVIYGPHGLWFESRAELAEMVVTGNHWLVHLGPHQLGQVPGDMVFVIAPE
ncbi:MAG TPA: hypothetical protein PK095_17425 [Myxococcota bacterium]|nr:hypothetical protein [Myxococcota bacterium]